MSARVEIPEDVLKLLGGPDAPPVVAAVSGGPDSVALMLLLVDAWREGRGPKPHLAHLNHRIRGAEADRDAEFVQDLAAKLGADATVRACNVPAEASRRKLSLEHAARECRYEFLEGVARDVGATWLATGHTADDQLETVLHHILRGAGIHGLAGMPRVRPLSATSDARIFRPLLDVSHADLVAFLASRGEEFRIDSTNVDTVYTRNRIRRVLVPMLEAEWPEVREEVAAFAREMSDLDRLIEARAAKWVSRPEATALASLAALEEPMLSYVIRALIARALGDLRRIDEVHVRMIAELITSGATGSSLDLPRGLVVQRGYDTVRFAAGGQTAPMPRDVLPAESEKPLALSFADATLPVPGETTWGGWTIRAEIHALADDSRQTMRAFIDDLRRTNPDLVQYLDLDRLEITGTGAVISPHPTGTLENGSFHDNGSCPRYLRIRARRPGDRFSPLGAPGSGKLKDYLIRRKVPHADRDRLPLVISGDTVVAVVTIGVSSSASLTEDTRRIVRLTAEPSITS